jgi:serine O-acetyltransferase
MAPSRCRHLGAVLRADFSAQFPVRRPSMPRMLLLALLEPGWNATMCMRLQLELHRRQHGLLARALRAQNVRLNGMDVQPDVSVGGGLVVRHPVGIVLGQRACIGVRCWLGPGVFVGRKSPERSIDKSTRVGSNVTLGAHSMVVGPVIVGDGAFVAAGAVVTKDVPPGWVVAGVPACRMSAT